MLNRRAMIKWLGGATAMPILSRQALAQGESFPTKPIRMVIPFPPGGAAEFLARPLAQSLGDKLHQTIYVDNRPGANTIIGIENVANAAADGYTILIANEAGLSLAPAFSPITKIKVPYQSSEFAPISLLGQYGSVMCVSTDVPAQTLQQFVAYARANPGRLSYASFGVGSQPQMMMEVLNHQAGIETVHVPYKGVAPALNDLIAGHVQAMISAPSAPIPFIREGRIRALAYSGKQRLPELPDVPTFAEAGMPDFEARGWFGVLVHANTPSDIKKQLSDAIWSIVQSPDYQRSAILANGFEVPSVDPSAFPAFLAEDMRKWKGMVEMVRTRLG